MTEKKGKSNYNSKRRFPAGMTKGKATANATADADSHSTALRGMTERKARARVNVWSLHRAGDADAHPAEYAYKFAASDGSRGEQHQAAVGVGFGEDVVAVIEVVERLR